MDEQELKNLISRITEQVIARLTESGNIIDTNQKNILVIVPAYVPDMAALTAHLKQAYGDGFECVLFEDMDAFCPDIKMKYIKTQSDRQQMMDKLKHYADVVLAVPPLGMIKSIAEGDDSGFVEQVFLKAILWEKKVLMMLDFEKPKFKRGTFFEGLSDSLGAIEDMGVDIVSLKSSVKKVIDEQSLVSEADVIDAVKSGEMRVKCALGAIVTPLARDKAKELGVAID